jgi:hypothetical protein
VGADRNLQKKHGSRENIERDKTLNCVKIKTASESKTQGEGKSARGSKEYDE